MPDSDSTQPRGRTRASYHHGDLKRVLIEHATDLLDKRGVAGFSLREVTRRAEVAAAAPTHHFGNVAGLLTAVAASGFERLNADFEAVLAQDTAPIEQVIALCEAYVSHGRQHPGMASVMFRDDLLTADAPHLFQTRRRSLHLLVQGVSRALADDAPDDRAQEVAKVVWATMHGLVALRMEEGDALRAQVGFAARAVLAGSDVLGEQT